MSLFFFFPAYHLEEKTHSFFCVVVDSMFVFFGLGSTIKMDFHGWNLNDLCTVMCCPVHLGCTVF